MDHVTAERWLPIAGWGGVYEVSDRGRVRSFHGRVPRILKPGHQEFGYEHVNLRGGGQVTTRRVHQLVAEAFIGPRPEGMEVRHYDGNPVNNWVSNLSYGTHTENMQDKRRHGTAIGNPGPRVDECRWGHPYDEANTYIDPRGKRFCRKCRYRRSEAARQKHVAARRAAKIPITQCANGHEFDEANTYTDSHGKRNCRACHRAREAARRAAKVAA